jgi:ABC-2 type transport system permease protein
VRAALIRSAAIGRQAPLTSALIAAAAANAILVALLCVALPLLGLPAAGSAALALAIGTCGAGLLADRRGRPAASAALRGPFALAARLQWPALAGWAAGYAVMFAVCGAAAKGLAQLPAAAVIVGVAALAYGAVPEACAAVAWSAVGLAVLLNIFGSAFQLSHWALDVSPFTHVPRLPGGAVTAAPLCWLSVIALALSVSGLAALRRRDIG